MGYGTLKACVEDLEKSGRLIRIEEEIDADLEAAEIHRRVNRSGGPALLFANVKNCRFPMVSNLFGTMERMRYIFRDRLEAVRRLIELKIDPTEILQRPSRYWQVPGAAISTLPRRKRSGPILANQTSVSSLPQLKSWPDDGGAFVTLPIVYTEDVNQPGLKSSNLGMYRVQLSGGRYVKDEQVGLHYQIHRGIGVHHSAAVREDKPFLVNIFVGGAPAMTFAAVMPLPEGMSELSIAGTLAGHRIPMICRPGELPIYAEADFCISGRVIPDQLLPEGPFGDHLGYYSQVHNFPVLQVERVYHRAGAIWPFTVVGRPPQEDSFFGRLIHEITGPAIPTVIPGVHAVHAVDAAGVHPLMLAQGSERYTPYQVRTQPQELLTQANAILGQGQMSLAKYLWIVAKEDEPELNIENIPGFFTHLLKRVDWRRDLHFHTSTTIDTLDYSGHGLNQGSKLVIAAVGKEIRDLDSAINEELSLPDGYHRPKVCLPGILVISGPPCSSGNEPDKIQEFCNHYDQHHPINRFPLIVVVDDSQFASETLNNFLWITFTRSNPAADVYGIESFTHQKHWGAHGSLVIDARSKPYHAPPLIEDIEISRRVDSMASKGGLLAKYL